MNEQHHTASSLKLEHVHTVPTHLTTVDTVLSLGELSLSSRQFLLLLVGGSLGAAFWTRTTGLVAWLPPFGVALHWTLLLFLVACTLILSFGQDHGRSFDSWVVVIIVYLARPRLYLWGRLCEYSVRNVSMSSSSLGNGTALFLTRIEGGEQGERANGREEPVA